MKNSLRVLRAERNFSQGDLADKLDVSRQTVNAIETGKYDPSLPLAFDMARVFEKKIEEIFTADPVADSAAPERARREKHQAADESAGQLPFPELDVSLM